MSSNPMPPYLTAALPGVGGRIKQRTRRLRSRGSPGLRTRGQGDHLFLWIEKTRPGCRVSSFDRSRERLGIRTAKSAPPGLKDRRAVTRQWVSVPAACEPAPANSTATASACFARRRHANKLQARPPARQPLPRPDPRRRSVGDAEPILDRIRDRGLPNFYGPQRFGRDGETATLGMSLLKGEPAKVRNPFLRKLALSAAQSRPVQ